MFSWLRTTTSSWLLILILGSRSRDITRLGSVYMVRLIFSGTSIIDWEGNLLIGVIRYDWSPVTYWYLWQDNTLTSYTSIVKTPSSFPKHGDVHFAGNMEHKFAGYLHYLVLILITIDLNRAQDEECEGYMKPLYCYECQTSSDDPNYCSDPFNATMLAQNVSICEGHCVKWVRQPRPGEMTYVRTCSTRLNLKLMINIVCMEESRPSSGLLCFCKEPRCNSSAKMQFSVLAFICAFIVILREKTWSHVSLRRDRLRIFLHGCSRWI